MPPAAGAACFGHLDGTWSSARALHLQHAQAKEKRVVEVSGARTSAQAEADIAYADQWMQERGEAGLSELLPLTVNDLALIGLVAQSYAYADLNARRLLEMIDRLHGVAHPPAKSAPRDSEVFERLSARLTDLPLDSSEINDVRACLGFIGGFALHRHQLVHWAARRHPERDVLILSTKNAREALRRSGSGLSEFENRYVVVPMPELRHGVTGLQQNVEWLANRLTIWWARYATAL